MNDKYEICPVCRGEGVTFLRVETLFDEDDDRGSLAERMCDHCCGRRVVEREPEDVDVDWGAVAEQRYWAMIESRG